MSSRGDVGVGADDAGRDHTDHTDHADHADHADGDDGGVFTLPTAPSGHWDQLTSNEKAWVEFIRVISCGSDPKITPKRVAALVVLLDAG